MFEIKRITNVNWTNSIVRATLDLIIKPHGIVLRDCMLKEGQHGWFVTSPSKKLKEAWVDDSGKTHEYMDLAFFPKEIRDELTKTAMEAYDPSGGDHTSQTLKDAVTADDDIPF
jgi:DNA-binding cell septation regulator SpoVG|tara:strand:- start:565 stop:906 length:342 start_codon:yes stop_codon:yes gene_type:complete